MLLDLPGLVAQHELMIHDILHVGAHTAEEAGIYTELGIERVIWIEANAALLGQMTANIHANHRISDWVLNEVIADEDGREVDFNITNLNGLSSSILPFGTHPQFSPEIVFERSEQRSARSIDSLVAQHGENWKINMLNMDIQGAELLALRGAELLLPDIDIVMTEVNNAEVYIGCAKIHEIDILLGNAGLERVETYWVPGQGWGDALYLRPA